MINSERFRAIGQSDVADEADGEGSKRFELKGISNSIKASAIWHLDRHIPKARSRAAGQPLTGTK